MSTKPGPTVTIICTDINGTVSQITGEVIAFDQYIDLVARAALSAGFATGTVKDWIPDADVL